MFFILFLFFLILFFVCGESYHSSHIDEYGGDDWACGE
jgi:hypothetical protein